MATPSEPPHSPELVSLIHDEIRRRGRITFHRFVELCLYHPHLGYYNSGKVRLGKSGDFYTSAHTAPVFARLLARHLERWWTGLGQPVSLELIELGPGEGLLAGELLQIMRQRWPEMFDTLRYIGVEQSAGLGEQVKAALAPFAERATMVTDWQSACAAAAGAPAVRCVLANEFFDALPFHILVWRRGAWKERYVCLDQERLAWCEEEPSDPALLQQTEKLFPPGLPLLKSEDGLTVEIRPGANEWMRCVCELLLRGGGAGQLLIVDYGYSVEELRQGRFPQGSALAYRRHQFTDDLLANPGEQDITAHVNFSELIAAGEQCGMSVSRFESQAKFLMEIGAQDEFGLVFHDAGSEAERLRRARLLKTLILPQGMGEAFRVLVMEAPRRRNLSPSR